MTTYRLLRPGADAVPAPVLDETQQRVVGHLGGPLLVLAGPGTGKTTTLVEAVVDRIQNRGASPGAVLALTFSRKAADQLRDRVTARLGRTMATTLSATFHSFAYGLVRRYSPPEAYAEPLRLLSAPEADVVLRQLLTRAEESVTWPPSLSQAVGTRGFAREVQAVLSRARDNGVGPEELERIAAAEGRAELVAAARFLAQYLDVLGFLGAVDYPELLSRAVALAERPAVRRELRGRYRHVFVDEYQDTDPSQVRLLRALAGDGGDLVAVGDPDQSVYGFRGAEVRAILDFPRQFRRPDGSPADVVALRRTRRFGPRLLDASRAVAASLPTTGSVPADTLRAFRAPIAAHSPFGDGEARVVTFDTERAETEHLADRLRRAHLRDGVPWSQMAVLVRSGRTSIPGLRRSLGAAGVPVEVAADDLPLVEEPAVAPLLLALRVVLGLADEDRRHFGVADADLAQELLVSPVGGLGAPDVRLLARRLRNQERHRAAEQGRPPRPSPELVVEAVLRPELRADMAADPAARKAAALGRLLAKARAALDSGATAEEVLWVLWSGTQWPGRLRRAVEAGGAAASSAHRDLDAVCALFGVAARAEDQRGHTSVGNFLAVLDAQRIPADTLAERGVRGDAVRLLTAHRSKGLEWRFVVVAHVQEGTWPDLRRRAALLGADRIDSEGLVPPADRSTLLAEERRLFYVACTRARQQLLVTAVASAEEDAEQPSRFLDELGESVHRCHVPGRVTRPLSWPGVVAELRRTVADERRSPALRRAAATRLARLASSTHDGRPLVPQADPGHWWGSRARTAAQHPVRALDEPVVVSAGVLEALLDCPAKWFLEREAGGRAAPTQSQGFGLVVHALADHIARTQVPGGGDPLGDLMGHVDGVWDQIPFRTPWSGRRERREVQAALTRFLDWHLQHRNRSLLASERHLAADVTLPDGQRVRLSGYADRLELDREGRVVVVDLKTAKNPPADSDVATHPQLGLYQHAVNSGAVDDLLGRRAQSGGAELVQLRSQVRGGAKIQSQPPQGPDGEGRLPVEGQLMQAVSVLRSEALYAQPGKHCEHCSFQVLCPVRGAGRVL